MKIKIICIILLISMLSCMLVSCQSIHGIRGEKGDKGDPGEKGEPGKDGTSLLTGNGAPAVDRGIVGDSYIDLDSWDFYTKTQEGWSLVGNIKGADDKDTPDDVPDDNHELNGTYELSHIVAEWIQTGKKMTYNLGDGYFGTELTSNTISFTANDGTGVMSYNFGQLVTRNVTYEAIDGKFTMICEEAVDLFNNGDLRNRLEFSIEEIDGKAYYVLNASNGFYNFSYYVVKSDNEDEKEVSTPDDVLNGEYGLHHIVVEKFLSGEKSTYNIGDTYLGLVMSNSTISVILNNGSGTLTYDFGSVITTNITYEVVNDKFIMTCEDPVDILYGHPENRYEMVIDEIDGKVCFVLTVSSAYSIYTYYVVALP